MSERRSASLLVGVLLVFAFALPPTVCAETVLGVRGGATFASISIDNAFPGVEYSNRDGFMAGVSAGMSVNDWLWLRFEPSYVQKGGVVDWPAGADSLDNTQEYAYLMLPINAKATATLGAVKPFAAAGFGLGFVVTKETKLKNGQPYPDPDMDDVDFTLDLGAGVDIPAGSLGILVVEGRYSMGLIDISPDTSTSSTKTKTWMIMGGLDFKL
jgi:Outer membrane protein beta-barrel domain